MTRLPAVSGAEVVAALKRAGFEVLRIKGSHHVMAHRDGRRTVVPVHGGSDIKRGLLRKIIDDAGMTVDEFIELL
ncbi:MAG: type II toxin-antitoxin system HicA family toxin [Hyphomicrobiaceae bacterium]|nr:type II toxin-antitoxin system HicA family toxin [Hyphomicrobiaceae bacterium]